MAADQRLSQMRSVEIQARTVDEAVQLALEHLDKKIDEVDVEVLNPGGDPDSGDEALVRVVVKGSAPAAPRMSVTTEVDREAERVAEEILGKLLGLMGLQARVTAHYVGEDSAGGPSLRLDVTGEDANALIGRRGETLAALQYLVSLFVSKSLKRRTPLVVDVEGYRARRAESLIGLAHRVAEKVKAGKRPIALESMPAYERRIVHLALQDSEWVTTASVGEGDDRRVVISPK